jgi:hypothetical protein
MAAAAEASGLVVLLDDGDFDRIEKVNGSGRSGSHPPDRWTVADARGPAGERTDSSFPREPTSAFRRTGRPGP